MAEFEFKAPTSRRPLVGTVVTGVIVVVLLGILIWAIVRHFNKASTTEPDQGVPGTSQNEGSNGSAGSSGDNGSTEPGGSGNESQQSSDQNKQNSETKPKGSANGSQLTDTGPGDVVAVFAGASALGAAGYHFYLRRRLARD